MSASHNQLATQEPAAAIGRFFNTIAPAGRCLEGAEADELHAVNEAFHARYQAYLRHPVNLVAEHVDDTMVTSVGFFSGMAKAGMYGWFVDITTRATGFAGSIHGRQAYAQLTLAGQAGAGVRRIDAQGRYLRDLLVMNADLPVQPGTVALMAAGILEKAGLPDVIEELEQKRAKTAERVAELSLVLHRTRNQEQQLKAAIEERDSVGFPAMRPSFRFPGIG